MGLETKVISVTIYIELQFLHISGFLYSRCYVGKEQSGNPV
jgi:hypothetical protein